MPDRRGASGRKWGRPDRIAESSSTPSIAAPDAERKQDFGACVGCGIRIARVAPVVQRASAREPLSPGGDAMSQGNNVIPMLPWVDAAVDGLIARAAGERTSVTIREILLVMGVGDDDPRQAETRAVVWMRLNGETLLPGLLGHVQRANALRLMAGDAPLSGQEIVGVIRRRAPGASPDLVGDVLSRFIEHLRSEGARLEAEASALRAQRGPA